MTATQLAHAARTTPAYVYLGEKAPGYAAKKIRRALVERELTERRHCRHQAKIARQRAVWADIPEGPARDRLIELMSNVAWELLNSARADEADLVLEIMPEADATKLLAVLCLTACAGPGCYDAPSQHQGCFAGDAR